jgi:ribosomal protein L32
VASPPAPVAILTSEGCQRPDCQTGQPAVPASAGAKAEYCQPCIDTAKRIATDALARNLAHGQTPPAPVATPKASPSKAARSDAEWAKATAVPCSACGQFSLDGPVCAECQTATARPAPKAAPAPKANVTVSSRNGETKAAPVNAADLRSATPAPKAPPATGGHAAWPELDAELAAVQAMCDLLHGQPDVKAPALRALGFARGARAYAATAKCQPTNMALSLLWERAQGAVLDARAVKDAATAVAASKALPVAVQRPETPTGVAQARPSDSQARLFAEMQDAAKAEALALAAEPPPTTAKAKARAADPVDPATKAVDVDASNALRAARETTRTAYAEALAAGMTPAECRTMAGLPAVCQHTSNVERAWCPACDHDTREIAQAAGPVATATPTGPALAPDRCPAPECGKARGMCEHTKPKPAGTIDVSHAPTKRPAKPKAR